MWSVDEPARRAYLEMKMPEVTYVDTFVVPNYEKRNPAPKYQLPFTADDSMKFIQVPAEFKLELFAKEPDIIEPIAFNFDERGRLWIIEAIDYPNVVLNGNPGDDRIKIVEDTNGDGRADKFTVFADHLNLPDQPGLRQRRRDRDRGAAHRCSSRTPTATTRRTCSRSCSTGWGIRRHARRAVEPDVRARQPHLGHGRLLAVQGPDRTASQFAVRPGASTASSPMAAASSRSPASTNNTWGLGMSRDLRRVRVDGEQRSELLRGDPQPLLRRRRGTADAAGRRPRRRRRLSERGAVLQRALRDALHPPGRRVRRLHRRRRSPALHRPCVPEAVLEPDRVHQRADRAPGRAGHHREARRRVRDARRLEPAGRRRRVGRAGAGAGRAGWRGVGVRLVQLHRPAQPDAAGLQQRRRQRLRDVDARRIARPHLPRRLPERAAGRRSCRCRRTTPPGWSRRCRPTTCCGGCTRSGCSSSADQKDVVPQLLALVRNTSVDEIGIERRGAARAVDAARAGRARRA